MQRSAEFRTVALIAVLSCILLAGTAFASNPPAATANANDVSATSLIVFGFRSSGDKNSALYARGFAQALADRLCCAPGSITQQYFPSYLWEQIQYTGHDPLKPVSDELAKSLGKALGVRYVVTGNTHVVGNIVSIRLNITDLRSGRTDSTAKASGTTSGLPAMQTVLATKIADAMGLKLTSDQRKEIETPNFDNPKVLELYALGQQTPNLDKKVLLRWEAAKVGGDCLFTTVRLMEFYAFGGLSYREVSSERRLDDLLAAADKRYPNNCHVALMKGLLRARLSDYGAAQSILAGLVKSDPNMCRAHAALAYVARQRLDTTLAEGEWKALVSMWPASALFRAGLADSFAMSGSKARQGRFFSDVSSGSEEIWENGTEAAFREASAAIKLNRNCFEGWQVLRSASLQLSKPDQLKEVYRQMKRLQPKDAQIYLDQAVGLWPQWGGTEQQRQQLGAEAEKVFGKNSYEFALIRAQLARHDHQDTEHWDEVLRLFDDAIAKSKNLDPRAMMMKCSAITASKKWAEQSGQALELAKQGFDNWHTPDWRYWVAYWSMMSYSVSYRNKKADASLLRDARDNFAAYCEAVPFSANATYQLGNCQVCLGSREEGKKNIQRALELDPDFPQAKQKLKELQ